MTEKLKNSVSIPNWLAGIFIMLFISIFTAGWVKVDGLEKEIVKEQTSRIYIEKKLEKIDMKVDTILQRVK